MRVARLRLLAAATPFVATAAFTALAVRAAGGPALHEHIPPDPREDLALHVSVDGELPAALQTQSGIVGAPDPRLLPAASDPAYRPGGEHDVFSPDRDTRRPNVAGYDEPFTPSTAPFKRLEAFDAVRPDYQLYVRDERLVPLPVGAPPGRDDEAFYADIVVDMALDARIRIPSVGPGAHIVRGRLGVGAQDISFSVLRDGADNWFLQPVGPWPGARASSLRARLVMELAAPKASFGGAIGDPAWSDLPFFPPLPDNVAREAAEVRAAIGVSRAMRPRDAIAKLAQYFRSFVDSDDPPEGRRSLYLDLALSRKGVCRHRAFAFLVTAQSLGVPTRLVTNEAHAWVEVHDGQLWRRLDLGGAGVMRNASRDLTRPQYEAPPDAFGWPRGATRGDQMVADARAGAPATAPSGGSPASSARSGTTPPPPSFAPTPAEGPSTPAGAERDERPASTITLTVTSSDVRRGTPLDVRGSVRADGDPCPHLSVELWLREGKGQGKGLPPAARMGLLGTLATDDAGEFAGRIVVPGATPIGEYDVVARTAGDARCGRSTLE